MSQRRCQLPWAEGVAVRLEMVVGHFVFTGWDLWAHSDNETFRCGPLSQLGFAALTRAASGVPRKSYSTKAAAGELSRGWSWANVSVDSCSLKVWMIAGQETDTQQQLRSAFLIRQRKSPSDAAAHKYVNDNELQLELRWG